MPDLATPPFQGVDLEDLLDLVGDESRIAGLIEEDRRLREIVRLAAEVRLAQKAYFADRATAALTRSKTLERELDRRLAEVTFREPAQTSLFGGSK